MKDVKKKQLNLALQGGGAHGAYTWGILDRLLEVDKYEIVGVSATSAGSMNAIVLAQGLVSGGHHKARELLRSFWFSISEAGKNLGMLNRTFLDYWLEPYLKAPLSFYWFSHIMGVLSPYQFNPWNLHPIHDILSKQIDFEKINHQSKIKLFICATNVRNGKIEIFKQPNLSVESILASACLPKLFQAVEINNEYYWDGGYIGNPAIFPLIYETDVYDVLILNIVPIERDLVPYDVIGIDTRIREVSFNSSLMRELRAINFVTKLIDEDWIKEEYKAKLKRLHIHCIEADKDLLQFPYSSVYIPDWEFLSLLFELGRKAADKWIKEDDQHIGKQSTINFDDWL